MLAERSDCATRPEPWPPVGTAPAWWNRNFEWSDSIPAENGFAGSPEPVHDQWLGCWRKHDITLIDLELTSRLLALRTAMERSDAWPPPVPESESLCSDGQLSLACELVEFAWQAAPDDSRIRATRSAIYRQRSQRESSLMVKGVFDAAARDMDPSEDGA